MSQIWDEGFDPESKVFTAHTRGAPMCFQANTLSDVLNLWRKVFLRHSEKPESDLKSLEIVKITCFSQGVEVSLHDS